MNAADLEAGQTAVDNAKLAYQAYKEVFEAERFAKLAAAGARPQRPLWASTGTKNPAYSDVLYVDKLTAAGSVNTAPPDTVTALLDHMDSSRLQIEDDLDGAVSRLEALEAAGISLRQVTADLEADGVLKFQESFESLMHTIDTKRQAFLAQLGPLPLRMPGVLKQAAAELYVSRFTTMTPVSGLPTQPVTMRSGSGWVGWTCRPNSLKALRNTLLSPRLACETACVTPLCGNGRPSLAPEVLSLAVSPLVPEGQVCAWRSSILPTRMKSRNAWPAFRWNKPYSWSRANPARPVKQTLLSTTSGNSAIKPASEPGSHFVAITDPGTSLEK